jgi:hypothetical protein
MKMNVNNSIRPLGTTPHRLLAAMLGKFRSVVGGDRFENLYGALRAAIAGLNEPNLSVLDYGCGTMSFSKRLHSEGHIAQFIGMDTYPGPEPSAAEDGAWTRYRQIGPDGLAGVRERFDVSMLVDVLHHVPERDHERMLRELSSVSRYVLVKDHFEHGLLSRQLLRLADWYGNFAYGVAIPQRYFDPARWAQLVEKSGLVEVQLKTHLRVHDGLFGVIIPPRCHFISVLRHCARAS